jgi:predicted secreted protein
VPQQKLSCLVMPVLTSGGMLGAMLAAILLAGCGKSPQQHHAATAPPAAVAAPAPATPERARLAPTLILTDADEGRALLLQRGQVVEVRLPADRSGGFTWIPAANMLPVMGTDGVPQYGRADDAPEHVPGTEIWRFIGREPGHAHLVFEYRRPLEADAPPRQTLTFHFDVE